MTTVRTLEEAYEFVMEAGICTIFSLEIEGIASLWEVVDLPEDRGETKWGQRIEAVWRWKNELPEVYPDDIYYGKIPGGYAALMSLSYLRDTHYPSAHRAIENCSELAQQIYEIVRLNPCQTGELRREAMELFGCSKSRFDTALKQLQVTLNIARSNEPGLKNDMWVAFNEIYLDLIEEQGLSEG